MRLSFLSLLSLALLATGCMTVRPGGGAGLVGPTWQLTQIGAQAPTGPEATLTFHADGRVSGTTGCNLITGTYTLKAGGALDLSALGTTRMACAPAAMEQERRVLDALADVERAEVSGGQLMLVGDGGSRLLTFRSAGTAASGAAAVSGTVTYLPRIALPPDAVVTVRLLDVSLADAPATTLAEQMISTEGRSVPIPFTLSVDPSDIDPSHRYVVRAEIREASGDLIWTTDTAYPVLNGAPSEGVEIRVVQVTGDPIGGVSGAARALVGPTWRLARVERASGVTLTIEGQGPYTISFGADGRYSGQADCNRYGGDYDAGTGSALSLDHGLTTLAACAGPSVSNDVLQLLSEVETYRVSGGQLTLSGTAGTLVFERTGGETGDATGVPVGPEWRLVELRAAGGAVALGAGEPYTIAFTPDGRFNGQADCNRYMGTYQAGSGGVLTLGQAATTLAACGSGSSAPAFFTVLNQVDAFSVDGGRLTLRASNGGRLVFERDSQGMDHGMPSQETLKDYAYTCDSPDGPFTFRTRTGPGEIALWLPQRFEGREGGTYRVLGQVRAASGAKYQDGPVTVWTKGQTEALLEVDGDEFVNCLNDPERSGRLLLRGTGDGWYLEVARAGTETRLHLIGSFEDREGPAKVTESAGQTVYRTDALVVTAVDAPCTDADNGAMTSTRLTVVLDGRTHEGCGERVG